MPFTIPNLSAAPHADQAFPNQADIEILTSGIAGDGVVTGCLVTAQGSPNMTVHVASGTVKIGGTSIAVSAGDPAFTAASGNPRRDLVTVDTGGALSIVAGTPQAVVPGDPTVVPVLPTIPSSRVVLAAVDVPANTITITSNEIIDKRVLLTGTGLTTTTIDIIKGADESVANNTMQNDDHFFFSIGANEQWLVSMSLSVRISASGDFQHIFSFPVGASGFWMDFGAFASVPSYHGIQPIGTILNHSSSSTDEGVILVDLNIVNGSNAGTMQYRWAQFTTDAGTPAIIRRGSQMRARRIA